MWNHMFVSVLLLMVTGCSNTSPVLNRQLDASTVAGVTGASSLVTGNSSNDDMALILTFSGGGTRAAALSYGVMQELRNTYLPTHGEKRSLLEETDLISSVSGGSFTAAYYGLYGDRIFTDYEVRFLKKTVQQGLIHTLLSPRSWLKLMPGLYNRGDLAADYFEQTIFSGKKFRDMRKDGPRIVINATDLSTGISFPFTPESFRWICSDLDTYPVGRAVAASSAVPVLFSSIVLRNYPDCRPFPHQIKRLSEDASRNDEQAQGIRKYQQKGEYPYLHLVDGGVSDNLGIRSILNVVAAQNGSFWETLKTYGLTHTRKVVFIVVNAADSTPAQIARSRADPGIGTTLSAVTTIQSRRYNLDTLDLLEHRFTEWEAQVKSERCKNTAQPGCAEISFYLVELNFKQLPVEQGQRLASYETSLELPSAQVDELISAGRTLLRNSPTFRQLVTDLQSMQP